MALPPITRVDDRLPNELFSAIIRELRGDLSSLFHVASACKLLKSEAEPLLYNSLRYTTTQESSSARMRCNMIHHVGPPPQSYIDNPSLAKYLQSISYFESPGAPPSEDMRMILSAAYSNLLPRLKSMEVALHVGVPHGFLTHGRFQLEVLRLEGSTLPANLFQILKRQKTLKSLRIVPRGSQISAIPHSTIAKLETFEGPFHVFEGVLPARKVQSLVWEPSASYEDGRNISLEHLSKQMDALTTLSYPISKNLPPLKAIVPYLRNLQYLVISDAWASFARGAYNEGDVIETLPNILVEVPVLRGLILTSNHYPSRKVPESIISNIFKKSPTLQFVDVQYTSVILRFVRWIRGQDKCKIAETHPQYRRLPEDIVKNLPY